MKAATLPSLRVEPALREAAESVLQENETLSALMETAVRDLVQRRQVRSEFLKRGIDALEEYRRTGIASPAEDVFDRLRAKVEERRKQLPARPRRA